MNKLFLITGPSGVGKSTISEMLANEFEKSALIEGDTIYNYVVGGYISPWKKGNHLSLFLDISINTIRTFLENGYDVIYNYIIDPDNYNRLKNEFKNYDIKFVVLLCDKKTILKRDSLRPLDCQMNERCIELLDSFKQYNYNDKYIIDTSNKSIENIVEKIKKEF